MTSALRQFGLRDRTFTVLSLLFLSMPALFLGMLLMYLFAFKWPVFPVLFAALLVTISNLVVDLAYTWLDPRVKYS